LWHIYSRIQTRMFYTHDVVAGAADIQINWQNSLQITAVRSVSGAAPRWDITPFIRSFYCFFRDTSESRFKTVSLFESMLFAVVLLLHIYMNSESRWKISERVHYRRRRPRLYLWFQRCKHKPDSEFYVSSCRYGAVYRLIWVTKAFVLLVDTNFVADKTHSNNWTNKNLGPDFQKNLRKNPKFCVSYS